MRERGYAVIDVDAESGHNLRVPASLASYIFNSNRDAHGWQFCDCRCKRNDVRLDFYGQRPDVIYFRLIVYAVNIKHAERLVRASTLISQWERYDPT